MPRIGPTGQNQTAATILGIQRNELERERLSDERKNASRGRTLQAIGLANEVGGIISSIADKAADRAAADSRLAREIAFREGENALDRKHATSERLGRQTHESSEAALSRHHAGLLSQSEQKNLNLRQRRDLEARDDRDALARLFEEDVRMPFEEKMAGLANMSAQQLAHIRGAYDEAVAKLRSRGDRAIGSHERGGIFRDLGDFRARGSLPPEAIARGTNATFDNNLAAIEELMRQGANMDAAVAGALSDDFFGAILPEEASFSTFEQSDLPRQRLIFAAALARAVENYGVAPDLAEVIMKDAVERLDIEAAASRLQLQEPIRETHMGPGAGAGPIPTTVTTGFRDLPDPDLTLILDVLGAATGQIPDVGPHGERRSVPTEQDIEAAINQLRKRKVRPKKKK